jgi:hypothetical protein
VLVRHFERILDGHVETVGLRVIDYQVSEQIADMGRLDVLGIVGRLDREFYGTEVGTLGSDRQGHVYRVHRETVHKAEMRMGIVIAACLDHADFGPGGFDTCDTVDSLVIVEKVEIVSEDAIKGWLGTGLSPSTADTVETTARTVETVCKHVGTVGRTHKQLAAVFGRVLRFRIHVY